MENKLRSNIALTEDITDASPVAVVNRLTDLVNLAHYGCYDSEYLDFIKPRITEIQGVLDAKLQEFLAEQDEIHTEE